METQLAQHQPAIHSVQMVLRENLYGFQGNQKSPYLKISVTDPKFISRLRSKLKDGDANYKGMWKGNVDGIATFDNIQYILRFMIDRGLSGMSWVEVEAQRDADGVVVAVRDGGRWRPKAPGGGGRGLGLIGRLMDEFEITSDFGKGTTVTARKWKR